MKILDLIIGYMSSWSYSWAREVNEMLLIPLSRQGNNQASTSSDPLLEQHSSFSRLPDAWSHDQNEANPVLLCRFLKNFTRFPSPLLPTNVPRLQICHHHAFSATQKRLAFIYHCYRTPGSGCNSLLSNIDFVLLLLTTVSKRIKMRLDPRVRYRYIIKGFEETLWSCL